MKPETPICPTCNKTTLVIRQPKYDGFTRIGEELKCTECGTVFDEDAAGTAEQAKKNAIFSDNEKPKTLNLFSDDEQPETIDLFAGDEVRFCRHCKHYVVNPFTQRCMLHNRIVEATDTCTQFTPKETDDEKPEE